MIRVQWRLFALAAAALTVASAWFALNGSRIAKPGPGTLAAVHLPAESPSLPPSDAAPRPAPAPLARALFGTNGDPLATGDVSSRILRDLDAPTARVVLAPGPVRPMLDDADLSASIQASAPVQFAVGIAPPRNDQYFGAALVPEESRTSDPQGPPKPGEETSPAAAEGAGSDIAEQGDSAGEQQAALDQGPAFAPKPEPNPRRGADNSQDATPPAAALAPMPQIDVPAGDTAPDVAAAATSRAAPDPAADGPDGMILLGVFRGSGSSRALVRTSTESARKVAPGDEINGWRVSSIGEDHIRLRRASQTRMLKLPGTQ